MWVLAAAFLATAAIYASVGFGGGSTYTAILALADTDPRVLPLISLSCNIIVVAGGTIRYARAGVIDWKRVVPLVAISAPLAWAGGFTPISAVMFKLLLGLSLLAVAALMLVPAGQGREGAALHSRPNRPLDLLAAGGLGYLAGLVGIGGGIFLAPLLHLTRWGGSRVIAATACIFILVNSGFGMAGQLAKLGAGTMLAELQGWWMVMLAVLVGGQIGGMAGIRLLSERAIRTLTALLVLYAAIQLLWRAGVELI